MNVSHAGGARPLAVVPPQQSPPKAEGVADGFQPPAPTAPRQNVPDQAKAAGVGRSLEAHLAKWDRDGDGTLDVGPRFSHGVMGALLQLQAAGTTPPPAGDSDSDVGAGPPAATPPAAESRGATSDANAAPAGAASGGDNAAAGPTAPTGPSDPPAETASSDPTSGAPSAPTETAGPATSSPDTTAAQLLADMTPPVGSDTTPDPSQLLDSQTA